MKYFVLAKMFGMYFMVIFLNHKDAAECYSKNLEINNIEKRYEMIVLDSSDNIHYHYCANKDTMHIFSEDFIK